LQEAFAAAATDALAPAVGRRPGWLPVGATVLAASLLLSLGLNVLLGVRLLGNRKGAAMSGQLRLAFADHVQEQELRTILLDRSATIIGGPSAQGVYLVQVPLPQPRATRGKPHTAETMSQLLTALRAHPAVRLAEPVSPSE
jgi:hypothetical protein